MPKQFLNINDFSGGINTVKNPRDLASNEAVEIENFDLSNRGELKPRGFFTGTVDGSAVRLQSNTVPKHVASVNAGHGLFYFEADDPTAVRGVTITGSGATGSTGDGPDGNGKYVLAFYNTNKIFINEADSFWINNGLINSDGKGIIRVSGSLSNDGVYTVKGVVSILSGATPDITGTNSHTLTTNLTQCEITVEETIITENVADGTQVTIGPEGFVGDNFLALGNTDDNKIDIYSDSSDAFSSDAISNIYTDETEDIDSTPIFNYYYADNILRVSDANFSNKAKTKWYGKIDRQVLSYYVTGSGNNDLVSDVTSVETAISHTTANKFYEEENDLAAPTDAVFKATGDVNGSVEFPANGAGWGLSVGEGAAEGSWESATYEFASTFIYDENQESLLTIFKTASGGNTKATFTNSTGFKELNFNVYAKEDLSIATDGGGATPDTVQANGAASPGDTQITVEGNNAESYFNIDDVVIDQYKRVLGVIKTVDSATQITFRAGIKFGLGDNDPLFERAIYPNRVSGGRIYIRKTGTTDDWVLFADIDITKGVRVSLDGEYQAWVQDNSTNSFRVTLSTHATTRAIGTTNWPLRSIDANLDTYSSINGFPQSTTQIAFGKSGAGFKTAVVCNRRAFVANVKYNVSGKAEAFVGFVFNHFGDRIMFSEIGKYDTFPNDNFIDVSVGDGEDYVRLESYGDRLLCFKQRTLQILNVASASPSNWFLEDTVQFAGVHYPYNVCKGEDGVVFANQNGLFIYGSRGIINLLEKNIDASQWKSFGDGRRELVLGYEPLQDQVIILDRASFCQHGYIYNLKTQSFSYGEYLAPNAHSSLANASGFEPIVTNFVNDSRGQLIISYDTGSLDIGSAGANTVHTTAYEPFNTGASTALTSAKLITKDFVLSNMATLSRVYKLYIHYRSTLDVTVTAAMVYYQIDQSGTWVAFNSGSMPRSLNTGVAYDIAVFTPSATFECQSIAIKIDSTVTTQLYINDMQIEYREIRKRVS
jgi:hypothetical protein